MLAGEKGGGGLDFIARWIQLERLLEMLCDRAACLEFTDARYCLVIAAVLAISFPSCARA